MKRSKAALWQQNKSCKMYVDGNEKKKKRMFNMSTNKIVTSFTNTVFTSSSQDAAKLTDFFTTFKNVT